MTQEYLFVGNQYKTKVQKYKPNPEKIKTEIICIKNTDCWIVSYTVAGENESSANILSTVNEYITSNFEPTVLTNDSSAYYNKRLFPNVNEFERKLRKLLYLKSAINKDDTSAENIKNLEEQDLGKIFELLFTDERFMQAVRDRLRNKTGKFTKRQIVRELEAIAENAIWGHLIGESAVPMLKDEHEMVRAYRNDVMHAHNIDTKTFHNAQELFETVNEQLDLEIGLVMDLAEKQESKPEKSDYNKILNDAIAASESYREMADLIRHTMSPQYSELQEAVRKLNFDSDYIKTVKQLQDLTALQRKIDMKQMLPPEALELREALRKIKLDPDYTHLREILGLD